jgi:hypothetical protein
MINLLMCNPSIILQNIVVFRSCRLDEFLQHWLHPNSVSSPISIPQQLTYQNLTQLIIWDISKLLAVVFGNDKLFIYQFCLQFWCCKEAYGMALAEGIDVEECEDGGGFVELEGGDVSCI